MADSYKEEDAKRFAANYRSIISDSNTGELAWRRILPPRSVAGVRDGDQYVEEGQFKNWEEVDAFSKTMEIDDFNQPLQTLPEDHGNRAVVIGQTPSASIYFRKKYFRSLASTAGWTLTFQKAMTNLMIQKSIDIATVEMLTKFRYMYGVRQENDGALTRKRDSYEPVGKEYNHYRMYWYGDNVGNYPGGILEVTNFTQLSTSLTVDTAELGSCSITMEDPYNLLYVSKRDIDKLFNSEMDPSADPNIAKRQDLEGRKQELERRQAELQAQIDGIDQRPYAAPEGQEAGASDAAIQETQEIEERLLAKRKEINEISDRISQYEGYKVGDKDPNTGVVLKQEDIDNFVVQIQGLRDDQARLEQEYNDISNDLDIIKKTGQSTQEREAAKDEIRDIKAPIDEELSLINYQLSDMPGKPLAQLKTGEYVYYKRDIDYLYHYVAGRSIFTVMDEVYVWMSPVKEDLFEFNVVNDLVDRLQQLYGERLDIQNSQPSQTDAERAQQQVDQASQAISGQEPSEGAKDEARAQYQQQIDDLQKAKAVEVAKVQEYVAQSTAMPPPTNQSELTRLAREAAQRANDLDQQIKDVQAQLDELDKTGSGEQTAEAVSALETGKSPLSQQQLQHLRLNAISMESEDIKNRLRMFGFEFDDEGNITKWPKGDTANLTGFALTNGMQVFSGVVSAVTEAWNDGVYTVTVNAGNNFKFLDMTRLTPAGSMIDSFGLLDTPITLVTDPTGKRSWHWLWGVRAMSGLFPVSNLPSATGSTDITYGHLQALSMGVDMRERFYAGYDAANLVSTILCGVPFDPNMQLSISIPDDDHAYYRSSISNLVSTPLEGGTFLQQFRYAAEIQNKVLGNFIPFAWVPADILSYELMQFSDENLEHYFDQSAAQKSISAQPLTDPFQAPQVEDAQQRKYVQDLLGISGETTTSIDTLQKLNAYGTMLAHAVEKLSTDQTGTEEDRRARYEAYRAELDLALAKSKDVKGADLSNFYISDVIEGYPRGDSASTQEEMLANAAKCLTYRDAQNFILLNRREDIVRNIDQTYAVIDMTYLGSVAARAFAQNMRDARDAMWQSERLSQRQILKDVADQLDWELFGDTQGNIIYRKRQFNCIPASVYKRKLVPYLAEFEDKVLQGKSLSDWLLDENWEKREEELVKYLPGIALPWVLVYKSPYLRAQLLELDYPIEEYEDELKYATELLRNSPEINDASVTSRQPRTRYHVYITDEDIISWSFAENENVLCRVDVTGQWDYEKNGADPRAALGTGLTGAAVDYDLWFHYGYRKEQVTKAWLRDAMEQIPVYALSYIAHAKAKILSGTITVVGNPFYQPGEVVYVESRNMLYYIDKVSHSFAYGGEFRTTLTLSYGHYPGYWIADPYYLQSTVHASNVKLLDKDDLLEYEKMLAYRRSLQSDLAAGGYGELEYAGEGERGDANNQAMGIMTTRGYAQLNGGSSDISNLVPPAKISATFDPVIPDRLRASKFFNDSKDQNARGLDYEKLRRVVKADD